MAQVKVWNDNVHPYEESFKGDMIRIPAKGYIEMDADEALQFRGSFKAPVKDADDNDLAIGFKMIRIEGADGPTAKVEYTCQLCKEPFQKEASLLLHAEHAHKADIFTDETAEAEIKRRPGRPAKAS